MYKAYETVTISKLSQIRRKQISVVEERIGLCLLFVSGMVSVIFCEVVLIIMV